MSTNAHQLYTEHDDMPEEDVCSVWSHVEEADKTELEQFSQGIAFKKRHRDSFLKVPSSFTPDGCTNGGSSAMADGR